MLLGKNIIKRKLDRNFPMKTLKIQNGQFSLKFLPLEGLQLEVWLIYNFHDSFNGVKENSSDTDGLMILI